MRILVHRDIFTEESTTSKVYVNDEFMCYGLEDKDRQLEIYPGAKVDGQTAIPRGTYKINVDYSQRFQTLMPHVLNVPGFEGIRIHPGNTAANTHGCLLVGTARGANNVSSSKVAYTRLLTAIEHALDINQNVTIEYQ